MWEINSNFQILSFFYSLVLGGIYSLIYDIFKSFRLSFKFSVFWILLSDIFYFSFISIITFCFLLATTGGEVRLFILLGCITGFFIIRATLSKIFVTLLTTLLRVISKIFNYISINTIRISDYISSCFSSFFKKVSIFLKNIKNTLKKHLKKGNSLLYTKWE